MGWWNEKPPVNQPKGPPPPPSGRPYTAGAGSGGAPANTPRGGPSDRPLMSPPGCKAVSYRPWIEFAVLFAGALLGSVIGSTAATAFVIWLMVV